MKTNLECFACFVGQGLRSARMAGADEKTQDRVVRGVMGYLLGSDSAQSPVELAKGVQRIVAETTGVGDPYEGAKEAESRGAARLLATLRRRMTARSADRLETGLRMAVAGNIIDYGPGGPIDLDGTLDRCLARGFEWDDGAGLRKRLAGCRRLAYLADNAGEIVFDRILVEVLMEEFGIEEVLFVVREGPFLNDALRVDAGAAGLDGIPGVEVVSMGPGVPPPGSRAFEVWRRVRAADLRLAKGQANAEVFAEEPDFFLLFLVKCAVLAGVLAERRGVAVRTGDAVLCHTGG